MPSDGGAEHRTPYRFRLLTLASERGGTSCLHPPYLATTFNGIPGRNQRRDRGSSTSHSTHTTNPSQGILRHRSAALLAPSRIGKRGLRSLVGNQGVRLQCPSFQATDSLFYGRACLGWLADCGDTRHLAPCSCDRRVRACRSRRRCFPTAGPVAAADAASSEVCRLLQHHLLSVALVVC
jgi:hypothetical protein